MQPKNTSTNRQTIHWFWHFTKPDKRLFLAANTLSAFATLVQDILPPLVASLAFTYIQKQYADRQELTFWDLDHFAWMYAGLMLIGFVLWRIQMITAWLYEIRSDERIYKYIFNHLQRQSANFHADSFGGALVSHTNKFAGAYEKIMDDLQWSIVPIVTTLVASLVILATITPYYALILLVASIAYVFLMARLRAKDGHVDAELAASQSDRTAKLADAITNIATVRSFANEKFENKLFEKQAKETSNVFIKLMRIVSKNEIISHSSISTIGVASFIGGLILVTTYSAPLGTLFLLINYTLSITMRLRDSNRTIRNVIRAFGDSASMTKILAQEPSIQDASDARTITLHRGRVVFDSVTYSYGGKKKVFDDLHLVIKPGEKVGLVGMSGGGKTTLTKLLVREDDLDHGSVSIDGHDISKLTLESLRSAISLVPQEPLLFHRTIAENISYGAIGASRKEIVAAAKMAHAHEFINELSQGYDTLVGERGVKLSGGQRQRIAIARAMLKKAPVLLLDEATSALDSESEVLIQDGLWKLMEGKTAIVIAHRLSTIQKMDRILVLDKGTIVEQGSHKDLLRVNGTYASLWNHQSGGFIEE